MSETRPPSISPLPPFEPPWETPSEPPHTPNVSLTNIPPPLVVEEVEARIKAAQERDRQNAGLGGGPATVAAAMTEVHEMHNEITALQQHVDALQKQIDESQIAKLQRQADELQAQIDELKTRQTQEKE